MINWRIIGWLCRREYKTGFTALPKKNQFFLPMAASRNMRLVSLLPIVLFWYVYPDGKKGMVIPFFPFLVRLACYWTWRCKRGRCNIGGLVNKIFIFYEDIGKIPRLCRRKGWASNLFDSNSGKTLPIVSKSPIKIYLVFLNYRTPSKVTGRGIDVPGIFVSVWKGCLQKELLLTPQLIRNKTQ